MRLLLLSNTTVHGGEPYHHALSAMREFCVGDRILFVPFALADHDSYTATVREALAPIPVDGAHCQPDLASAFEDDDCVVLVGGGNTFRLLKTLQDASLVEPLRKRIADGLRYAGSSAGTVICGPSIRTTNDMPIVEPKGFAALNAFGFHLNCHYYDKDPADQHMGESRELRLRQFHEENSSPVLAMREGAWLEVDGDRAVLAGETGGQIFRAGQEPIPLSPHADVSDLLRAHAPQGLSPARSNDTQVTS